MLVAEANRPEEKEYVKASKQRIAPVGTHTDAFGTAACSGLNTLLSEERSPKREKGTIPKEEDKRFPLLYKSLRARETEFNTKLTQKGLTVKEVAGDGNCLFRSVSDQIYGSEEYHDIVRKYCMDYIDVEKEFFSQYIVGGIEAFESYVTNKRQNGVWGDDLEIEALSEMYELPIEIYAYDDKPMRTFHEATGASGTRAVQLSYHGRSHFNSVSYFIKCVDNTCKRSSNTFS